LPGPKLGRKGVARGWKKDVIVQSCQNEHLNRQMPLVVGVEASLDHDVEPGGVMQDENLVVS
jgi:hypothetical protein